MTPPTPISAPPASSAPSPLPPFHHKHPPPPASTVASLPSPFGKATATPFPFPQAAASASTTKSRRLSPSLPSLPFPQPPSSPLPKQHSHSHYRLFSSPLASLSITTMVHEFSFFWCAKWMVHEREGFVNPCTIHWCTNYSRSFHHFCVLSENWIAWREMMFLDWRFAVGGCVCGDVRWCCGWLNRTQWCGDWWLCGGWRRLKEKEKCRGLRGREGERDRREVRGWVG